MIKRFENFITEGALPQEIIYILQDITDDGWEIVDKSYGGPGNRIELKSPTFNFDRSGAPRWERKLTDESYRSLYNEMESKIEEVIQPMETIMLRINEVKIIRKCELSISFSIPKLHSNNRTSVFKLVDGEVQKSLSWSMDKFIKECINNNLTMLSFRFYIFTH